VVKTFGGQGRLQPSESSPGRDGPRFVLIFFAIEATRRELDCTIFFARLPMWVDNAEVVMSERLQPFSVMGIALKLLRQSVRTCTAPFLVVPAIFANWFHFFVHARGNPESDRFLEVQARSSYYSFLVCVRRRDLYYTRLRVVFARLSL